jgi:hypothetical protein
METAGEPIWATLARAMIPSFPELNGERAAAMQATNPGRYFSMSAATRKKEAHRS